MTRRGELGALTVTARVAGLARAIAEREVAGVCQRLGVPESAGRAEKLPHDQGPGNVVLVEAEFDGGRELFMALGERGVAAERVAEAVADEAAAWRDADVPVGEHLADQLLLPMAMAGGGRFVTVSPSAHTLTNARVIERFLPVTVRARALDGGRWEVVVAAR